MPTTVNLNTTNGAQFTWASSTFAWSGADAGKSWASANVESYELDIGETIATVEQHGNDVSKAFTETLSIKDSIVKKYVLSALESIGLAESWSDQVQFMLRIMEYVRVGEQLGNKFTMPVSESFGIAEAAFEKHITLSVTEAVKVAEAFGRTVAYHLLVKEGIAFAEALSKAYQLSKTEALSILEEYRRHGNAVVSDMILATTDITLDDFLQIIDVGHAPGFSPFRDFVQGDYQYQNAIFRAVLESVNADRARLTTMKVTVDVPDVFDSGEATVTTAATGIAVTYNRTFHVVPEITITLKGGTVIAIPKVVNPTETGFTVMLYDTSGNPATGTVSWAAHGY